MLVLLLLIIAVVGYSAPIKFGFGSCNKQWKDQSIWDSIQKEQNLTTFIWLGDVVYVKDGGATVKIGPLKDALTSPLMHGPDAPYQKFINTLKLPVVGIYDDHDYGVNDGGKYVKYKHDRQQLFLDFLKVDQDSPRRLQEGIYNTHLYQDDANPNQAVKVILLDTRYDRDDHVIPSLATKRVPGVFAKILPHMAILTRFFSAFSGLTLFHQDQRVVLAESQWKWFEDQLYENPAEVNIIGSSIQVLTSNPLFESWGHFPPERNRLLKILADFENKTNKTILIISGDVHIGEILSAPKSQVIEVTSSGLTHTCTDGFIPYFFCRFVHMMLSTNHPTEDLDQNLFIGYNFGTISVDFEAKSLEVHVKDAKGNTKLSVSRKLGERVFPDSIDSIPGITPATHVVLIWNVIFFICFFIAFRILSFLLRTLCCCSFKSKQQTKPILPHPKTQ